MLTTSGSTVINLYGSSGVGKTRLATEAFTQWDGTKFKVDLREVDKMEDLHLQVFLALSERAGQVELSYEVNTVIAKMEQVKHECDTDILLFLDNADDFMAGENESSVRFANFLDRLLGSPSDPQRDKGKLKILLTSRSEFSQSIFPNVQNHEVRALEKESSDELLQSQKGLSEIPVGQRDRLVNMCRGKPLLLNGMAAILRQEIADASRLLGTIEEELGVQPQESESTSEANEEKETFDIKEEGIDEVQLSCLRKIFHFLPSNTLKESAVSVSLFCRPFTEETAAKILDVEPSEAAIRLEGMRNSKVISVTEEKELFYDIHPLMRNFLKNIGLNVKAFSQVFQKARDNFSKHFISKLKDVAALLDKDYVKASESFDVEKQNLELALDISLKSDSLLISKEHRESVMICYVFEAMLDENQRRRIFNSWADKTEEDGKEGSVFRSEMRCREALQVLKLEGWGKAMDVLKEVEAILGRVQKESKKTDSYKLTRSSYLFAKGEVYYRAGNFPRALKVLNKSLKIMDVLLRSHTSTSRCLSAIGNCCSKLNKPEEAIKYYQRAFEMRQELSPSGEHFDMPFFQNQIGTVYEGQKNFDEAIEHYKKALDLAKNLKLPGVGVLYTAIYNRNIGNAYAWIEQYDQAYEYAKKGYEIRKDVLGNHPYTARSAFQMAEICLCLSEFGEADEYYKEAWNIEKSLGQGNHSDVRDRIIYSYGKRLKGQRKEAFDEEVFEFYKRSWNEERNCEDFAFTQANKNIIDRINERLESSGADKETRKKYQKEALLFYEGTWNSPDTKKLPYKYREEILDTLLRLCKILGEQESLGKYQVDEFKFFEKKWKKRKEQMSPRDKTDILHTLVNRATFLGLSEKVIKYNRLLQAASKGPSFLSSVFSFGSAASSHDNDDDISDDSDIDTAIAVAGVDDDDDDDDDVGGEEGKKEGGEGNKQEGDEQKDHGGNEDEVALEVEVIDTLEQEHHEQEVNIGENNGGEIGEGVIQAVVEDFPLEHHEVHLEQPEESVKEDPIKTQIYEGTVANEGIYLDLKLGAVHLTFPPDAVSEPTPIMVHRWKCNALSPPLAEHEAVVSNVIGIYANTDAVAFEFNNEVKLVLSHSAPDLKGYELVIKRLVDAETNEWEDVDGSEDFRCLSDIVDDYPSPDDIPDFSFPVVQADITECSTYAVVCRLKLSPAYTITVKGGTFIHPDYPDVMIAVPQKAVANKTKLPLKLKVQEVLQDEFDGVDGCSGPILRILGSPSAEFLNPVTIQLPISHQRDPEYIPDPSVCRVRIFFLSSDEESKKWIEITNDLESPASFDGNFVKFQVRRFSGYTCFVDWCKDDIKSSASGIITYLSSLIWNQPREANFFAYFKPTERLNSQDILFLICCPAHLRKMVKEEHDKEGITSCDVSSRRMIPGQEAFVFVSGGMCPASLEDMDDFCLRFAGDTPNRNQLEVRLISDQEFCRVEFRSTRETTGKNLLSKLSFKLPTLIVDHQNTPVEFFGIPLNDEILLQAEAHIVLAACRSLVAEEVYQEHYTHLSSGNRPRSQVLQNFFTYLAALSMEVQEECFEAIINITDATRLAHVIQRLQEGREAVMSPLQSNRMVISKVSENAETLWKRLARTLHLTSGRIDIISEEESSDYERCCKALETWCEVNGQTATIRKLMIILTQAGLARINHDIMNCLGLLERA
ncbi:uncharacterized protein [Montipora foliosa]|uniref:uncharacterized protein n=1 Tax=Montipora foliosa TaxID=591990 RepID=UPI0035F11867